MIWNDSISPANRNPETLERHIAAEIQVADFPQSSRMHFTDELARSVAEFVAQRFDGVLLPADYLLVLTCRALWAIGQEQTAMALLRAKGAELNITESFSDAIFDENLSFCLANHPAFVRALRASSSAWNMNNPCWILDLRTVFSLLDAGLELTVWRVLHVLVKQLAVLWDAAGGRGALGLKNLHNVGADLLGFPCKSRQGKRFATELIRYCERDLKMAADERKWPYTPWVMDLDQ